MNCCLLSWIFLNSDEIYCIVSRVNRHWFDVIHDRCPWKARSLQLFSPTTRSEKEFEEFTADMDIVDWRRLYRMVNPTKFSQFDPARTCASLERVCDGSYLRFRQNMQLSNCSSQTLNGFKPKNQLLYIWEVKVQTHKSANMSIGLADHYFRLEENFVGYRAQDAPDHVKAPSFSLSSDGKLRKGLDSIDSQLGTCYGESDHVTIIVRCDTDVPSMLFFKNGELVADWNTDGIDMDRMYYFSVTLYSPLDELYIVTEAEEKQPPPREAISEYETPWPQETVDDFADTSGILLPEEEDDEPTKRRYTYSISIDEVIEIYKSVRANKLLPKKETKTKVVDTVNTTPTQVVQKTTAPAYPPKDIVCSCNI